MSWFDICSTARVSSASWPAITVASSCADIFCPPDVTPCSDTTGDRLVALSSGMRAFQRHSQAMDQEPSSGAWSF
jgi:hypothetical protein